jgi:hypothetical protein
MIDADTYQGSFQLEVLARLTAGIAFIKNSEKSNIGRPAFKLSIRVKNRINRYSHAFCRIAYLLFSEPFVAVY